MICALNEVGDDKMQNSLWCRKNCLEKNKFVVQIITEVFLQAGTRYEHLIFLWISGI